MVIDKHRVDYIDALRGFSMVLVVLYHVGMFSYGTILPNSYYQIFNFFMLPLFFFVCGWCYYKPNREYGKTHLFSFIANKFRILVIPSILFMLLSIYVFDNSIADIIFNKWKAGYWFTLVLFLFFLLCELLHYFFHLVHMEGKSMDILMLLSGLLLFVLCFKQIDSCTFPLYDGLSVSQWWYYLYFVLGVLIKKHFNMFIRLADNHNFVSSLLLLFIITFIARNAIAHIGFSIVVLILSISGTIVVFTFFRKKENHYYRDCMSGKMMMFIGKRTMDIYMIHYFILPRHLQNLCQFLKLNENPVVEFFVSSVVAAIVIVVCLALGNIIRLSPLMSRYLLGTK